MQHLTAMRQKGRFAGFSLYVSNTTDLHSGYLCYKDGPELPPLDFNITCLTNGHYIIFYNEHDAALVQSCTECLISDIH